MEHIADGLIRDMKVEDMHVDENGRTYVTYSFGPVRPLDKLQFSITKTNNTPWDDFKNNLKTIVDDMEKYEAEICEYNSVQILSNTDIGEFIKELAGANTDEPTHCEGCQSPLDEEGFCPQDCEHEIED